MTEIITSISNPLVKHARLLRQKKYRDETRLFLVEGIKHVGDAVEANWDIEVLFYCPERLRSIFGQKLVSDLQEKKIHCLKISEKAFDTMADKENPQGIAAIVKQKERPLERIAQAYFSVGLVSPQDPGNVGTVLRTMDASGASGLFLIDGGADPYHPSAVRASMGALFWIPFFQVTFQEFIDWAKKGNIRVVGTSAHAKTDFRALEKDTRRIALLLGSEQKGLLPEQIALCENLISLPMRGKASSLNLAVAAGILMYSILD